LRAGGTTRLDNLPLLRTGFIKGKQMKKINWLIVGIIAIAALLLVFGGGMLSGFDFGNSGYHGWGMMGRSMMGSWGYSPFGWLGMAFMWLFPVAVVALIVFGVAALVKGAGHSTVPTSQGNCSNCLKGVQADWKNCPYCGTALK
jgi:uncharacterized membrane protein